MVQMTCQQMDKQTTTCQAKNKTEQFKFLVLESFIILSPGLAFLGEVQKYQPIIWADRDSSHYHRLDESISENLLFPYCERELPCLEAISEYKVSIQFLSLRPPFRGMDAA